MKSPTMRDTLVPRRAASMRAHSSTLSSTVMVRFFMAAIVHEFRATRNSCRHMIPHWPLGALLPWCYKQSALPLHFPPAAAGVGDTAMTDRKSTRLNSSHHSISYAVFCLKKKNTRGNHPTQRTTQTRHKNTQTAIKAQ